MSNFALTDLKEGLMNNIFVKNLTALNIKNPELAKKLQTFLPSELPNLVQENGAYNISYKGKLIHNPLSPLGEAQEIFSMAQNTPVAIHLIYGLGLGYLFQLTSANSKGTVILYEPDLNIMWLAFTLVDFSQDILKKNVFIASDFDTVAEIIHKKSGMDNTPELLSLTSQREFNPSEFDDLVMRLRNLVGTFFLNLKFTRKKFYKSLRYLLINYINFLKNEIPLMKFKDVYKGKTAVVVSAGPTLDRNIEALKKNRDKYILFTVGTAAKTLYKNGLKPDFLCLIETFDSSAQLEGLDLSDVNFITEPYSHPFLRKFKFKNILSHIGSNMPINHFWAKACGEDIEEYHSRGTVSYTALNCARILGCSKIILVGQDLAYIEGQCYSKESAYKDLICEFNKENGKWEITAKDFEKFANSISNSEDKEERFEVAKKRLDNLNKSLYYVKSIKGEMIPTESVYAAFVQPLSDYTKTYEGVKYINTSLVGAQIDGFENMSLEEALNGSENVGDIELKTDFVIDVQRIEAKFNEELAVLKPAKLLINDGIGFAKNLRNELNRYKSVNKEVLKLLKKLSENYILITSEYTTKSETLDFVTISHKVDLDYEMKMTTEFNFETVNNLCEKLSLFYEKAEKRVKEIERLINASFDTKG